MVIDNSLLVLGSSSIPAEDYEKIAFDLVSELGQVKGVQANNPNATKLFVESLQDDPYAPLTIYRRALKCIDDASFIVVDISAASTGMGMEVVYLVDKLSEPENEKKAVFIAKQGTKTSPHIAGLYQHKLNKPLVVYHYKTSKEMISEVKCSPEFEQYTLEPNN